LEPCESRAFYFSEINRLNMRADYKSYSAHYRLCVNKNVYVFLDRINKNVYNGFKLNKQEEAVKQSEFRRWLEAQGAIFKNGTNHLKISLNGRQSVMPRHPGKEIPEPLRKAILKQLGIK